MSSYHLIPSSREETLLGKLNTVPVHQTSPKFRRFRRKLIMRYSKRNAGKSIFDLDAIITKSLDKMLEPQLRASLYFPEHFAHAPQPNPPSQESQQISAPIPTSSSSIGALDYILDRYWVPGPGTGRPKWWSNVDMRVASLADVMSGDAGTKRRNASFVSPLTGCTLKPRIWSDPAYKAPKKLQVLRDIVAYSHRDDTDWIPDHYPIEYVYLRPWHIRDVNALLCQEFWDGIDMSECLEYPEYTIVVMYRRLVIGCGILTPGFSSAYVSYIAVHPDWQGSGIATVMLYHLLNTGAKTDVMLHVRADNPAMIMYQRFGFKPEQFVFGYFAKYHPPNSEMCSHAYFLRLRR